MGNNLPQQHFTDDRHGNVPVFLCGEVGVAVSDVFQEVL
jgi:hypothetical protein